MKGWPIHSEEQLEVDKPRRNDFLNNTILFVLCIVLEVRRQCKGWSLLDEREGHTDPASVSEFWRG